MASKAKRSVTIRINGKEVRNSFRDISKEARNVRNQLNEMIIGSEDYNAKAKELEKTNRIIAKHRDQLRTTKSSYDKMGGGLKSFIGIAAGAFTIDRLITYTGELASLGTEMEVMANKAQTVLADQLEKVNKEAEKNANIMGLTKGQYIDNTAAIADLLIPMKFSREEAAGMSTSLLNLSGALSEWDKEQRSSAEVADILSKAILGEREQLKGLGISISEADVKTRLAEKGMQNLTGEMLQQAKAAVTLELITEKSADAQAAFADNSDTLVRKQALLRARFDEVKEQLATALIPVFHRILDATLDFTEGFSSATEVVEKFLDPVKGAVNAVDDQATKVKELENELNPLIDRYEELTEKTNPSKEEQKELSEVIQRIGEITPTAITQIDEYGRVLSINTDASREFLEAEKLRLKFINQDSIQSLENQIEKLQSLANVQKRLAETGETGGLISVKISPKAIDNARKEFARLNEEIRGAQAELERLSGDNLDSGSSNDSNSNPSSSSNNRPDSVQRFGPKEGGIDTKAIEKAESAIDKLRKKVGELKVEFETSLLSDDEQAVENITQRYDKELAKALELSKSNNATIAAQALEQVMALEQLKSEAIAAEQERQFEAQLDKDIEQAEKLLEEEKKQFEAKQALEQEIKALIDEQTLSDRELEIQQLEEHYQKLLDAAEKLGIDTTELTEIHRERIHQVNEEYNEKDVQQRAEAIRKEANIMRQSLSSLGSVIQGFQAIAEASGKRGAQLAKTLALVNIATKTAEAIAAGIAASAGQPFPANLAAIATTVATVLGNIASAKKILSEAPNVPQKKKGGFFNVRGLDDGQTYNAQYIGSPQSGMLPNRPVVLASEAGPEYFVSNRDLQNPVVLNYVRAIENIRTSRGIRQFQDGGFTQSPVQNDFRPPSPTPGNRDIDQEKLSTVLERLANRLDKPIYALIDDLTITDLQVRAGELSEASGGAI